MAKTTCSNNNIMMKPTALLLDFDGLLVDTERACFEVASAMVADRGGAPFPLAVFQSLVGRPLNEQAGWIRDRHAPGTSLADLVAERNERLLAAYRAPVLMPGASELVAAAQEAGLAIGVASSSVSSLVETGVAALPFADAIRVVVCADHAQVGAPKPAPDIYLAACRLLKVQPSQGIAVEDSPSGATAALLAGLQTIVVPNVWTQGQSFPDAAELVTSLHDLIPRLGNAGRLAARRGRHRVRGS
jgi:pseudouridine-5'-monophosphatase